MNPEYKEDYFAEAKERGVNPDVAWDQTKWYDLETREDWLEKAGAIMRGEDFDTRVEVPLDLDDETMMNLFMLAHKKDVTLNKMVEIILQEVIDKTQNKS